MPTLTVVNWTRWQSYRSDRGQPPWIKVHRTVLRNPEWTMLTDAQRGQLVQIWILAADKGGRIECPDSVNLETFIQSVCCMKEDPNLQVFEELRFIKIKLGVKATPRRRQHKTPRRRQTDATVASQSRVEKSSTETETDEKHSRVSPPGGGRPPLTGPRVCPPSAKHAWCDGRMHVPGFIHQEFQRTARDDFDLYRWYADTDLAWTDQPIGDDAPTFWRARWREHHGTTRKSEGELINDARQKRNEEAGAEFERELQGGT